MTRTPTLPPDDPKMWRRLLGCVHPDAGGPHELFIWTRAIKSIICDGALLAGPRPVDNPSRRREPSTDDVPRVPFDPTIEFSELTRRALVVAEEVGGVHGALLEMLEGCEPLPMQTGAWAQRGASYKKLAAVGHMVGFSNPERVKWYRVAEHVPLSDRHVGHILARLKRAA